MNTSNSFLKTTTNKYTPKEKLFESQRVKTSSTEKMPIIKEYTTINKNTTGSIKNNIYGTDLEKLREEIYKQKCDINRRNREINNLKITNQKNEIDNKRNMKIIEEILQEVTKNTEQKLTGDDNLIQNIMCNAYVHPNQVLKLKEAYNISSLKRQIYELKQMLKERDEEVSNFRNNSRISKYNELEAKYKSIFEEYELLSENFEVLKMSYSDKDSKLKESIEERDYYKILMNRIKSQYDESKEKISYYVDANSKISEQMKAMEEKCSSIKYSSNALRNQIKDKENSINNLKNQLNELEEFKYEKDKIERDNLNFSQKIHQLKEELDKKNKKIKDLEAYVTDLKGKNENLFTEKKKLEINLNKATRSINKINYTNNNDEDTDVKKLKLNLKEKESDLIKLEEENSNLREKTKQLDKIIEENSNTKKSFVEIEKEYNNLSEKYILLLKDSQNVKNVNLESNNEEQSNNKFDNQQEGEQNEDQSNNKFDNQQEGEHNEDKENIDE